MYPDAPVYTAFTDQKAMGRHWERFADWDIRTTWLQRIPFIKKIFSPLRILAPGAFSDLDLSEYDIVLSSSNAYYAKAIEISNGTHICYCHTPPRSLYGYPTMTDWKKNPIIRVGGNLINHYLRVEDYRISQRVDHLIANSEVTRQRICKFYRRDATIIHPPVEIPDTLPDEALQKEDFYLYVNRLGFSKNPHLAVQVATQQNLPLKVVGSGPMREDLEQMAGDTVEFLGSVDDETLYDLYARAKMLLYPVQDEDFGMIPVEAMGYGTPVVAHRSGGPTETIMEGKTGLFFEELNAEALCAAMKRADEIAWDAEIIHHHAQQYSLEAFKKRVKKVLSGLY